MMGRPRKPTPTTKAGVDLHRFVKSLKKTFGNSVNILGELEAGAALATKRIGTGAINLDWALGGGLGTGRIIELYSVRESEGKTTLSVSIMKTAQQAGAWVAFIDAERVTERSRIAILGVDIDNLAFYEPDTMEEAFQFCEDFMVGAREQGHKGVILIVLDSVAASLTESQFKETDYEKQQYAPMARVLSAGLRKINKVLSQTGATILLTNQTRTKIGVKYGKQYDTTGGRALKFYCSQRIELRKVDKIQGPNKTELGITVRARIEKNKLAPPLRTADIDILYASGVDPAASAFRFAMQQGVIEREGNSYRVIGEPKWKPFKQAKFNEFMGEHPEMEKKICDAFDESLKTITSNGGSVEVASEEDSD
jgi:recombination protein RecA